MKKSTRKGSAQLMIRCTPAEKAYLRKISDETGVNMSKLLRMALIRSGMDLLDGIDEAKR